MRLVIAAVGRLKEGAERALVDRYAARLGAGRATAIGPLVEHEVSESRRGTPGERQEEEAGRLLKLAAGTDLTVLLDERGRALDSAAFARWLGGQRDGGVRAMAFLIGGPDGHGEALRRAAGATLSLGPMTLPHGLARAVLAEQLYRAATILAGHPYHRG